MSLEIDRLYYRVELDFSGLDRDIAEFNRKMGNMNTNVQNSSRGWGDMWKRAGQMFALYFSVDALAGVARGIIQTRSEFEKFASVLTTSYGSQEKAARAMAMLRDTATETPFQLAELTESFILLKNRGLEPSKKSLINLGDFASSTGKTFEQLAQAILDANNSERWREFGVETKTMGDRMALSFKGTTIEVQRSAAGAMKAVQAFGKLDGIAGSMAGQMNTLGGKISNLKDSWDKLLVTLGDSTAWKTAVEWAGKLVEKMNDIFDKGGMGAREGSSKANKFLEALGSLSGDELKQAIQAEIQKQEKVLAELNEQNQQRMKSGQGFWSRFLFGPNEKSFQHDFSKLKQQAGEVSGMLDILRGKLDELEAPPESKDKAPGLLEQERKRLEDLKKQIEEAPNKEILVQLQEEAAEVQRLIEKYENLLQAKILASEKAKLEKLSPVSSIGVDKLSSSGALLTPSVATVSPEAIALVEQIRERNTSNYRKMLRSLEELEKTYQDAGIARDQAYYKQRAAIIGEYSDYVIGAFSGISQIVGMFDQKLGDQISRAADSLSGMASGFATGNYAQAITSSLSLVLQMGEAYVNMTNKTVDLAKEQEKINEKLRETLELFNDLNSDKSFDYYKKYNEVQKESEKKLEGSIKKISDYEKEIEKWKKKRLISWTVAIPGAGLLFGAKELAERKKANEEIEKYEKLIEKEKEAQESIKQEQEEAERKWKENITATTSENLASAIVEGFKKGQSASEIFANNFRNLMINALGEVMTRQIITDMIGSEGGFYNQFAAAFSDQQLTPEEVSKLSGNLQNDLIKYEAAWKVLSSSIESIGGATDEASQNSLQGAIKGVTEETAGILAGQMGAIRINVLEQLAIARQGLNYLQQIEANTRTLYRIESLLSDSVNDMLRANGR